MQPNETIAAPAVANLVRLHELYLAKLTELSGAAVSKDSVDTVSIHVTATKLTELFGELKRELIIMQTTINHP